MKTDNQMFRDIFAVKNVNQIIGLLFERCPVDPNSVPERELQHIMEMIFNILTDACQVCADNYADFLTQFVGLHDCLSDAEDYDEIIGMLESWTIECDDNDALIEDLELASEECEEPIACTVYDISFRKDDDK